MKRILWISGLALLVTSVAAGAYFAADAAAPPQIASLMPEGSLLYIEAKDFHALLGDWQSSAEKRTWLASDNYQDFSRSHLFSRLSQAQDEFATAAGVPTGIDLLDKVAGSQSALALYDIGNLEFVYVTRLPQQDFENTPLWQSRNKFEQRSESGSPFFVRQDTQSQRVAAFACKDGWLILGTREDLVAGVLDRLQSPGTHQLATEAWFAQAIHRASASPGDLRMVLNLDKIVPSPYFHSYWVQRNATEMKQYSAAISDLYRTPTVYREERVLLRRSTTTAPAGDVAAVTALVPENIGFWSAQASPNPDQLLDNLRRNLLELKPSSVESASYAPPEASAQVSGSASNLDVRIDQAPAIEQQADAWQPMRTLLEDAQPTAVLELGSTVPARDDVFIPIQTAAVITAAHPWNEQQVTDALTASLTPNLTAAHIGLAWQKRSSPGGNYLILNGQVPLCAAVRDNQLLLASDSSLLERMLALRTSTAATGSGVTYSAVFRHTAERDNFIALTSLLDRIGNRGGFDGQTAGSGGDAPAFLSGNIASFSRVFAQVAAERIDEKDLGDHVTQTVMYQWQQ